MPVDDNRPPTLDYRSPDDQLPPPTNETLRSGLGCGLTFITFFFLAASFMVGIPQRTPPPPRYGPYIITGASIIALISLGIFLYRRQKSWGFLRGVLTAIGIVLFVAGLCFIKTR